MRFDGLSSSDTLHDLEGAGESVDVAAEHPEVVRELRADLDSLLAKTRKIERPKKARKERAEEKKALEELEALGYGGEKDDE